MFGTAAVIVRAAAQWPVRSQHVSRRNALLACTALAERRRELDEVEAFLQQHVSARSSGRAAHKLGARPA